MNEWNPSNMDKIVHCNALNKGGNTILELKPIPRFIGNSIPFSQAAFYRLITQAPQVILKGDHNE